MLVQLTRPDVGDTTIEQLVLRMLKQLRHSVVPGVIHVSEKSFNVPKKNGVGALKPERAFLKKIYRPALDIEPVGMFLFFLHLIIQSGGFAILKGREFFLPVIVVIFVIVHNQSTLTEKS